jgi:hypothetical protein
MYSAPSLFVLVFIYSLRIVFIHYFLFMFYLFNDTSIYLNYIASYDKLISK